MATTKTYNIANFCDTGSSDYFHDTPARPLLSAILSVCPPTPLQAAVHTLSRAQQHLHFLDVRLPRKVFRNMARN